ncbi:MAG: hypothetical protein U0002_22525 [Thermoanaerobaculia bacterium]
MKLFSSSMKSSHGHFAGAAEDAVADLAVTWSRRSRGHHHVVAAGDQQQAIEQAVRGSPAQQARWKAAACP